MVASSCGRLLLGLTEATRGQSVSASYYDVCYRITMPAPRKPGNGPSKVKATRFTDDEWAFLVAIAEDEGKTPAQFIRESALGTAIAQGADRQEILGKGSAVGGVAVPGPEVDE